MNGRKSKAKWEDCVMWSLWFQLLHVLAAGPRISKSLDNIVQLVLILCGLDFWLIVIREWCVNYPMLPHRTRGGTSNGILRYRLSRRVGTWLALTSWGPPLQCCLLNPAVSFIKWWCNLLRGGCKDQKSGWGYLENKTNLVWKKVCRIWNVGTESRELPCAGNSSCHVQCIVVAMWQQLQLPWSINCSCHVLAEWKMQHGDRKM